MEANLAVRMVNITKTFSHVVANNNITLEIHRGEILSLLGENGSGKTTLMNMLSGIYFPDSGQIYVNGEEVSIASPKDALDLHIGMIHQHFKLVDVFTAAENIILGLNEKAVLDLSCAEYAACACAFDNVCAKRACGRNMGAYTRRVQGTLEHQ